MTQPSVCDRMLTVRELAQRLRIGRTSAYRLCAGVDFPSVRVGNQIRVPEEELNRWLKRGKGLESLG